MTKTAFITGASSGIGYACAEMFARNGYNLIVNARRKDRLEALAITLQKQYGINVQQLIFDVRDKKAVFDSIATLQGDAAQVDVLVNNAGLALGLSDLHNGNTEDWEQMIDTNVKGLLYVSRALIPGMVERNTGHIFNVGSIAGKETYLKGNVYCATKHAVNSLSSAMRMELVGHNIKVSLINPGAVETEFSKVRFKGDKEVAKNIYKGYEPLKAEDIAKCIEFCISLPAHVNINDMLIMPTAQASATIFDKRDD